jgi:hypothetical protein
MAASNNETKSDNRMEELKTLQDMIDKSKVTDKLVIVLFNEG